MLSHILPQLVHLIHKMHVCGLVHCNIKLSNILLDYDTRGAVKIIDFGLIVKMADPPMVRCGTLAYLPPEAFRFKLCKARTSADW
jgi:serine/threonine protein kinase